MSRRLHGHLIGFILVLFGSVSLGSSEILWDSWGIPHIYADTEEELLYAWGWAQMHSHGNLLLEQFGIVRGKASEYWGEAYLESDRYIWTMGLPQLVEDLSPALGEDSSFVDGMNAYAEAYPGEFDPRLGQVLPIRNEDTLALAFYDEFYNGIVVTPGTIDGIREGFLSSQLVRDSTPTSGEVGSNGWAIGPSKSTTGNALLLINPHAPWPSLAEARHLLFFESHLISPGLDFYGVGLIGLPALTFGFNGDLGWAGTAAPTFDFVDVYELTLQADGYLFDGEVRAFETDQIMLKVLLKDGSYSEEELIVRRSIHGPVLAETEGRAIAVTFPLPGEDEVTSPQLWDMMRADSLEAFQAPLGAQNLFALNFLYADRQGNILYVLNGIFPDRPDGDYDWSGLLPGDTSATLWRGKLPFEQMPIIVNPDSGYVQSANEPPHYAAWPEPLFLDDVPHDWPEAAVWPRTLRSLALLSSQETFSVEDVMRLKFDTRSGLADQVLDTVVALGRQYGRPEAQEAAELLAAWDRRFDADSVGALLFAFWAMHYEADILGGARFPAEAFAVPFDPDRPLETPVGLADPARAVEALEFAARAVPQTFGSLQVPWGAFYTFSVSDVVLPGFGAPPESFGLFSPNFAAPTAAGPLATVAGDTWVAVVEFGDTPSAWAVLPYGNASQPGNPHVGDQLALYANKQFRPVWYERSEIIANLERVETFE
ncbi:MAG: penicillin acylase family protein [Trueperaceae bacterium]|nr:MAG: penicillin acylase family protein [Trueperaceae bacterium]